MASKKLNELMLRAQNNELTADDINVIVLAIADNEQGQDAEIKTLKINDKRKDRALKDIEEEYPLLPPEADDISKAVRKKGVEVMGGKKSGAYNNKDLRTRVYRDIYGEIKRQYGLEDVSGRQLSYKKLKRKYFKGALGIVAEYVLPIALANEVEEENEIDEMLG
jgi:hypothetical protein